MSVWQHYLAETDPEELLQCLGNDGYTLGGLADWLFGVVGPYAAVKSSHNLAQALVEHINSVDDSLLDQYWEVLDG